MKNKIFALVLLSTLVISVRAHSSLDDHNVGWTAIAYTGPFSVSTPIQITMSSNALKSLTWTIHDWDLFQQGETQASRHNTDPAYSMTLTPGGQGVALTNYDGTDRENVESDLGWSLYNGVESVNAQSGYYTIHIQVTDAYTVTAAVDTGIHHEYVTVIVN